jgi:transmembrane sensor
MSTRHPTALTSATGSIAEDAAHWIVRLTADDAAERETARSGFEAWKQADPRHAQAADRMQGLLGQVQTVRDSVGNSSQPARAALNAALAIDRKPQRGKRLATALAVAFALGAPTWLALQNYPPSYLMADVRTATAQWETQVLSDGTRITLNSASAVNLHFDAKRRAVTLVRGEILVDVARDPGRPFLIETAHGSIRALGTRFVVSLDADATVLSMLESSVSVQTAGQRALKNSEGTVVHAGQRVRITAQGLAPVETIDARSVSDAWKFHQLVVDGRPLPEVLDALGRHRPGRIQYNRAQLEGITVSAVLPLDDTNRALQLLITSFPGLRVRTLTPYLVMVDAPPGP